jgi:hypothetical protein
VFDRIGSGGAREVPLTMKFSGTLSDEGVQLLEKSVVPACQRAGKRAFLLLSRETVSFVQDENESGGMLILARVKTGQLFELTSFLCTSRTDDCICIRVSLDVLLKALRSASAHGADSVGVSLKCRPLRAAQGWVAGSAHRAPVAERHDQHRTGDPDRKALRGGRGAPHP